MFTKKLFILCLLFPLTADVFEGYTLFTPGEGGSGNATTYLKNNDLSDFKTWSHSNSAASMPYLIAGDEAGWENTLLIYPYRVNNPTMESGGVGGGVQCLTWNGDVVWNYTISNTNYQHHHDVEPLPNGNILMIAWEKKTSTQAYSAGRQTINNSLNQMWATAIFEIENNGNGGGDIVWEWHIWDHLIQDADSSVDNYGVVYSHPELFDINNGNVGSNNGPGGANADWMHINAISYNTEFDQIVLSSRFQDEIFVIDHSTTTEEAATHSGGNSGKGGDFLYRWGNPQNYDRGNNSDHILGDQHGVNWIPEGFPGEGNFILFNNSANEAIEFIPPVDEDGNYFIENGEPYGPDNIIWNSPYVSTQMQGGAFRQPNGNTLITDCDSGVIKEYSVNGAVDWTYSHPGNNSSIARAQKYSIDYFDNIINILPGDVNNDGLINILDVVSTVNIILGMAEFVDSADYNGDGVINVLDIVSIVNVILGS
tara:strand:+ start:1045 stop:2490 length:1446 start_codon:yes stop_codon:yes gene_type:complete